MKETLFLDLTKHRLEIIEVGVDQRAFIKVAI
jgi:hypothetical protein